MADPIVITRHGTSVPEVGDLADFQFGYDSAANNLYIRNGGSIVLAGQDQELKTASSPTFANVTADTFIGSTYTSPAGTDMIIVLLDNAGARKVDVQDSDGATVASIDSNGGMAMTSAVVSGNTPGPLASFQNAHADGYGLAIQTGDASNGRYALNITTAAPVSNALRVTNAGNTGLGTTFPARRLEVNTGAAIGGIRISYNDADGSATFYSEFLTDGSGNLEITTTGGTISLGDDNLTTSGNITTTAAEIIGPKGKITVLGGYAVLLTNKTGDPSVKGQLVKTDTATDDAVILTGADDTECIGVFLDAGIADGAEAWVVVSGIADVAFDDNFGPDHGDWVETSEAGYANSMESPAAAPTHFREIGHCLQTVAADGPGTHVLARCLLHFL